jgi:tartrate dehydrogenase/decarboxylase/D-malate dehydrogenase
MIWSGAMMLDFLGAGRGPARAAHDAIVAAIEHVLETGPHTADMGGNASTREIGQAIAAHVSGV